DAATLSASILECAVVNTPSTSILSFSATGTPCNGPRRSPRWISSSARLAASQPRSSDTVMKAWTLLSIAEILASDASISSLELALPSAIKRADLARDGTGALICGPPAPAGFLSQKAQHRAVFLPGARGRQAR